MSLTIHVNVICCFCQHNGWDIDPNGGVLAGVSFNRKKTGPRAQVSEDSGGTAVNNQTEPPHAGGTAVHDLSDHNFASSLNISIQL